MAREYEVSIYCWQSFQINKLWATNPAQAIITVLSELSAIEQDFVFNVSVN